MNILWMHRGAGLVAGALAATLARPAAAGRPLTVAIMPAQYFSADAQSAQALTRGLVEQFEGHGYAVVPQDKARAAFGSLGLHADRHYADQVAVRFGRELGADLVVYPRLLALGVPAATLPAPDGRAELLAPAAVLLVRVANVHTKSALYARQVGHTFSADAADGQFHLSQPVATAAAAEATELYFARLAGSRGEAGGLR